MYPWHGLTPEVILNSKMRWDGLVEVDRGWHLHIDDSIAEHTISILIDLGSNPNYIALYLLTCSLWIIQSIEGHR